MGEADLDPLAEEIESLGCGEKRELVSRLTVLLLHLLKWRHQPALRAPRRRNSIRVASHLRHNPSPRASLPSDRRRLPRGAHRGGDEIGLDEATFPDARPWTFGAFLDEGFWPE